MKTKEKKQLTDKEIFNSWIEKNRRRKERKHLGIEEMTIDFAKYYHEKRLALLDFMESDCDHEWLNHSFDHFGFLQEQICDKCGAKQSVP